MDNKIITLSPTPERDFLWFAQYNNNEYYYEYDNKFNKFDDINKDELKRFGMTGLGMILDYNVKTGVFNLCGTEFSMFLKDSTGNIINICNDPNTVYNDCISYKSAETVLIGRQQGKSFINGYHFGYKVKINNFNIKIIVHIPLYNRVNIDISISTDTDLSGELYILGRDQVRSVNPVNLIKNQTSNINWIVG